MASLHVHMLNRVIYIRYMHAELNWQLELLEVILFFSQMLVTFTLGIIYLARKKIGNNIFEQL